MASAAPEPTFEDLLRERLRAGFSAAAPRVRELLQAGSEDPQVLRTLKLSVHAGAVSEPCPLSEDGSGHVPQLVCLECLDELSTPGPPLAPALPPDTAQLSPQALEAAADHLIDRAVGAASTLAATATGSAEDTVSAEDAAAPPATEDTAEPDPEPDTAPPASEDDLERALEAYFQRQSNGSAAPDDKPTGPEKRLFSL